MGKKSVNVSNLVNPIRSKIFFEIHNKQQLTAKNLLETFPDVTQPTMYRHLKAMLEEGMLKVVGERPVRGAVEKSYAINLDFGEDIQRIIMENDGQGYLQLFSQYMMGIMAEFTEYASRDHMNIVEDMTAFSTAPVYATNEELVAALTQISEIIMPLVENTPAPGRKLRNLCTILTPPQNENKGGQPT